MNSNLTLAGAADILHTNNPSRPSSVATIYSVLLTNLY